MLAWAPLAVVVALSVMWRLDDPMSSPVIPAEDPYTHMALIREHMADGEVEPLNSGGGLYPPGFHLTAAAAWAYSGLALEDIVRFGPVVFGAIGVLGMGLLAGRHLGPVAGFVAALAYAIMPEAIFRTTMMAPTALDLAILPFLLYAVLELVRGNLGWGVAVATGSTFLLVSHPWLLPVLCLAGVAFAGLALLVPWRGQPLLDPRGLAIAVILIATPTALALTGCSGWCGSFDFVVEDGQASTRGEKLADQAPLIVAGAVATAVLLALVARPLVTWLARERRLPAWPASLALATVLVAGVWFATWRARKAGFPEFVDPPYMFGWPILILAAVGLVVAAFVRTPAGHLGAALAVSTYPFVVFNPLDSAFWPHRTAVYLGVGLALLCGVAAGHMAQWLQAKLAAHPRAQRTPRLAGLAVALAALIVAVPAAGALVAGTPSSEERHWYRLFTPCGDEGLREVAARAAADPGMLVVTGSWQSKLVIAAYATDADRIWFTTEFFGNNGTREDMLSGFADQTVVAIVDPHLRASRPDINLTFLDRSPWSPAGTWCDGDDTLSAHAILR